VAKSRIALMAPLARSVSTLADDQLYTLGLQNVLEAARVSGGVWADNARALVATNPPSRFESPRSSSRSGSC